jgi:hypothetical protein
VYIPNENSSLFARVALCPIVGGSHGTQDLSGYPACNVKQDCKYRYTKGKGYGKNNLIKKEKKENF